MTSDPYRSYSGVNEVLFDQIIETKQEFDELNDVNFPIYLGGYSGDLDDSEQDKENIAPNSKKNYGFCFSTKKIMLSCPDVIVEHGDHGIATGWDGTWNLCHNSWVLANVGTVNTRYRKTDRHYGQTFNLHAFCLAKSETILGFRKALQYICREIQLLF